MIPLSTFLQGCESELFRVLTSELINAPSRHHFHFPLRFAFQLCLRLYMSAIDMIALRLKLKILCFPQKLSHGLQRVRQSAHHCTTDAMTIHNDQSSIKRIYMTLKCMCVFLLFPLCFFSWRPIKNDSVTPYVFFMTTDKKLQCYPLCFIWLKRQCYPSCFIWLKQQCVKNNSVPPYVLFDKYRQCYPFCFFQDDQ